MPKIMGSFALVISVLILGASAYAEETVDAASETKRLLIAYDSSNSMWGELADKSRKYEAGRTALSALLDTDLNDREIGFRAYGHRDPSDCRDSELIVPFTSAAAAKVQINQATARIRPTGKTPITYSLQQGLKDFDGRAGDILLISDGVETCDIDPCDLVRDWQDANINIRVHVVGVGLTEFERQAMACVADVSGGKYFDADSSEGFAEALGEASVAIEAPSDPNILEQGYALRIIAVDDQERSFLASGKLYQNGQEIDTVSSHERNDVSAPGDYEIEVGVVLRDGSLYKPVRQKFAITQPGQTTVKVLVTRPAIVTATFFEDGEAHRGSNVTAFENGKEAFKFRASDEALARPGNYEFRATPNADNQLTLTQTLVEAEHTELVFELTTTITFYVRYQLPNGDKIRRGSELWRDGEKVYNVFSGNPTRVVPGKYELRSDDQNTPLTPVEIDIKTDGETIVVPLDVGFVTISYPPSDDYVATPDRAWLESLDRGNSKYASLNTPIPAKPGRYRVNSQTSKGFMDPVEILVVSNQTVEAVFTPAPLGEIVVNFEISSKYEKQPDRASVYPLEGQKMLNGFMRPGVAKKFLPGRYRVDPKRSDTPPREVEVKAHETTTVTLTPN